MIFWETKFKYAPRLLQGEMIQQLMNPAEGSCWPSKQTQEETPHWFLDQNYFLYDIRVMRLPIILKPFIFIQLFIQFSTVVKRLLLFVYMLGWDFNFIFKFTHTHSR